MTENIHLSENQQTSYEIVRRAIEFEGPARLPLRLEEYPTKSDVTYVRWNQIGTGDHRLRETYDEWGCLWVRSEMNNMGQIKSHPLEDWDNLAAFNWPDPHDPTLYDGMEVQPDDKYHLTTIFMLLFERMQALRGFSNVLTDFYLEQERIETLADRIVDFDLAVIGNLAERFPGQIHGMIFSDDWGTQQNLMISPALWREFFKPRYARLFKAMHDAGWHVWMHTDGRINAILDDLIEMGLDVINLQQPRVVGIEEIGEYCGRICFDTSVDIQQTLPFKDANAIREEARLLLHHWAHSNGGLIVSTSDNESALDIGAEKIQIMLNEFKANDPWR